MRGRESRAHGIGLAFHVTLKKQVTESEVIKGTGTGVTAQEGREGGEVEEGKEKGRMDGGRKEEGGRRRRQV